MAFKESFLHVTTKMQYMTLLAVPFNRHSKKASTSETEGSISQNEKYVVIQILEKIRAIGGRGSYAASEKQCVTSYQEKNYFKNMRYNTIIL